MSNVQDSPEYKAAEAEVNQIALRAGSYSVTNAEGFAEAGEDLKKIKGAARRLEDLRTAITRPMDAAKKAVLDLFRGPEERLANAERQIKRAMITWQDEERARQRAEQARLDEIARREREAAERKAAAERAKAEAARQAAEAAARAGDAAAAAKAAAAAERADARAQGQADKAATSIAPSVVTAPPKIQGVSTRQVAKFEITDPSQLPREYLMPDEKKIRGVVNALKAGASIPGVRVWLEDQVAAGAA